MQGQKYLQKGPEPPNFTSTSMDPRNNFTSTSMDPRNKVFDVLKFYRHF